MIFSMTLPLPANSPNIVGLIGFVFIVLGIVLAVGSSARAEEYENAYNQYLARRQKLTGGSAAAEPATRQTPDDYIGF